MRHGSGLTFDELRDEAHKAISQSELTQEEVADRLDVARGSIASAVVTAGPRYQKLQMRIIQELTDYQIQPEREIWFRCRSREAQSV